MQFYFLREFSNDLQFNHLGELRKAVQFYFLGEFNNGMQFNHLLEFLKCHAVWPSWGVFEMPCSLTILGSLEMQCSFTF